MYAIRSYYADFTTGYLLNDADTWSGVFYAAIGCCLHFIIVGGNDRSRVFKPSDFKKKGMSKILKFDIKLQRNEFLLDVEATVNSGITGVYVITSYSIHYTKLYENRSYLVEIL